MKTAMLNLLFSFKTEFSLIAKKMESTPDTIKWKEAKDAKKEWPALDS